MDLVVWRVGKSRWESRRLEYGRGECKGWGEAFVSENNEDDGSNA